MNVDEPAQDLATLGETSVPPTPSEFIPDAPISHNSATDTAITDPLEVDPVVETDPAQKKPTARLAIQSLQLKNFKSYGGVVDVGPFHKNFSSIVGPNGSGKSNVIDAMLFVFGRRAKQLRHSKLSELLHNSASFPNVDSATVTVYFHDIVDTGDGEHDYTIVPGSEFSVSRTAYRNNTSKYHVDGAEVKMKSVVDLLKSKGVDLDNNRFLILQGEVEQISLMKPKATTAHEDGLLEYLEDIIGSNRRIESIDKAAATVETLNEERSHKLNRVKAAERERDALESAKVEAEDFLDKERDMLGKKITLGKARRYDSRKALKENTEKLAEAKEELRNFKKEVEAKFTAVSELEETFKSTQKKEGQAVHEMNKAKEAYTTFERKDIKLQEDIKAMVAKEKKLNALIEKESKRLEDSTTKVGEYEQEKEDAEASIASFEDSLKKAQEKFDNVREKVKKKTAPVREKLEKKQAELLPFSEAVNAARQQLEVDQSTLKLLAEKLQAPQRNLEQAKASEQEISTQLANAEEKDSTLQAEVAESKRRVSEANNEISQRRAQIDNISRAYADMRRRVEEARAAREFTTTRSRLLNAIPRGDQDRRFRGVVGRLGDLASIDREFDTAVSAAAGSTLDCIVVQAAEDAQVCIEFLRRENLGRATFIILDKMDYLRGPIESWSRSGRSQDGRRLFDSLNIPNPAHRTALYYALRDTLVANSLEEARRMAFKPTRQNRVVTIAGELIESTGAMTGGGRAPTRFKLGSGASGEAVMDAESFNRLNEEMVRARGDLDSERQLLSVAERKRAESEKGVEVAETQVTRIGVEISSLQERLAYLRDSTIPELQKAISDLKSAQRRGTCEDSRRFKELEKVVEKGEKNLENARGACEGIESDIANLQEEIIAGGGGELERAKKKVEECRSKISEMQSEVSTSASRAKAALSAVKKASAAVKKAEADIADIEEKVAQEREESERMRDDAEAVHKEVQEADEVHKEWASKLEETRQEYDDVKDDLKKLRRTEVSLIEACDGLSRRVEEDKYRLTNYKKEEKKMMKKVERLNKIGLPSPTHEADDNEDAMDVDKPAEDEGSEDSEKRDNDDEPSNVDEAEGSEADDSRLSLQEKKRLETEIAVLESELSESIPNINAIAEYGRKDGEYRTQVNELDGLTSERDSTRRECDRLRKLRLDEFMSGFSTITLKLKELYQMITLGGDAELELVDSLDPFSEGIVFSVRPPKKSWKNICNLSGGEKTLSSLALVFALHHFKPTPLYFLDEIDAALDYKNVSIVGNYIRERTKDAQFIIISLRNNMFELADRLVGIYKTRNATKSVSINPSAFVMAGSAGTASQAPSSKDTNSSAWHTQSESTQATNASLWRSQSTVTS